MGRKKSRKKIQGFTTLMDGGVRFLSDRSLREQSQRMNTLLPAEEAAAGKGTPPPAEKGTWGRSDAARVGPNPLKGQEIYELLPSAAPGYEAPAVAPPVAAWGPEDGILFGDGALGAPGSSTCYHYYGGRRKSSRKRGRRRRKSRRQRGERRRSRKRRKSHRRRRKSRRRRRR
jgi:hypothetical protein